MAPSRSKALERGVRVLKRNIFVITIICSLLCLNAFFSARRHAGIRTLHCHDGDEACADRLVYELNAYVGFNYTIRLTTSGEVTQGLCAAPNFMSDAKTDDSHEEQTEFEGRVSGNFTFLARCTNSRIVFETSAPQVEVYLAGPGGSWTASLSTNPAYHPLYPNGVSVKGCPMLCQEAVAALTVVEADPDEPEPDKPVTIPHHGNWNKELSPWQKATARLISETFITQPRDTGALPYNHMGMVARLPNSTLVAAWQTSSIGEGRPDQHIRMAYSLDPRGRHWSPPFKAPVNKAYIGPRWSPVLHVAARGALWLFYSQSISSLCHAPGGDIWATTYTEHGGWQIPRLLLSAQSEGLVNKVLANRMLVTHSGVWLLPYWRERGKCRTGAQVWAGVLRSADSGRTWQAFGRIAHPKTWLIENTLVELPSGRLIMLFRTSLGTLFQATSTTTGTTWTNARPLLDMPNPDAKPAVIELLPPRRNVSRMRISSSWSSGLQLPGELGAVTDEEPSPPPLARLNGTLFRASENIGPLALALNDHPKGLCPHCRTHLKLALSTDGGASWRRIIELEKLELPGLRYHYPTLLQVPTNNAKKHRILMVYSVFFMSGFEKSPLVKEGIKIATIDISIE
ncbi:hypothetical protein CYMTET_47885 [Cymbomonas tetramitiformis]|uniref:Sialidase domain-containing protein n=1 Tax=Cymbomonas tetramitiformis TaxID=36881 RepID=A0AAE0BVA1_9CHLO|nr:hypothetical protein CYMTET_47885 [Cymbomonas tetramitiformis]